MIALVDYGAGNLTSVRKALAHLGAEVWTPATATELTRARGMIIPGVGHFDSTKALTSEWRTAIRQKVDDGTPLLGICVGLQWLFEGSQEAPDVPGLGVFDGTCVRVGGSALKVPHVGWNALDIPNPSNLMHGVENGAQVYFTHSYAAPLTRHSVGTCDYGLRFSAAVERGNVAAVQFHPEKSGEVGLRILNNFLTRVRD